MMDGEEKVGRENNSTKDEKRFRLFHILTEVWTGFDYVKDQPQLRNAVLIDNFLWKSNLLHDASCRVRDCNLELNFSYEIYQKKLSIVDYMC